MKIISYLNEERKERVSICQIEKQTWSLFLREKKVSAHPIACTNLFNKQIKINEPSQAWKIPNKNWLRFTRKMCESGFRFVWTLDTFAKCCAAFDNTIGNFFANYCDSTVSSRHIFHVCIAMAVCVFVRCMYLVNTV